MLMQARNMLMYTNDVYMYAVLLVGTTLPSNYLTKLTHLFWAVKIDLNFLYLFVSGYDDLLFVHMSIKVMLNSSVLNTGLKRINAHYFCTYY